jgi:hypothetical protein
VLYLRAVKTGTMAYDAWLPRAAGK